MAKRAKKDDFDWGALGQAIVDEAKKILHERHLAGEVDPSWQECLQEAQKTVIERMAADRKLARDTRK